MRDQDLQLMERLGRALTFMLKILNLSLLLHVPSHKKIESHIFLHSSPYPSLDWKPY